MPPGNLQRSRLSMQNIRPTCSRPGAGYQVNLVPVRYGKSTYLSILSPPCTSLKSFSTFAHHQCFTIPVNTMYLEPKGRNWGDIVNWDDLGKLYAAIICLWTLILIFGVTWLILNRRLPHVKIRNLPLAIVSTLFLHIYLVKILLAYTTNGHFLCSAEFWIMSIYLPFGIALFQAYLTQLRSIWEQQQHLVRNDGLRHAIHVGSRASMVERWMRLSRLKKSYCFIAVGMLVQVGFWPVVPFVSALTLNS